MVDVQRFMDLFVHRTDVFASQQPSGAYFPVREELTEDWVQEHLAGQASYGVYVILPELYLPVRDANDGSGISHVESLQNTVKYVVFDLDTHDPEALEHLTEGCSRLVESTEGYEPTRSLLLESSGSKGFHVWLFLSEPVGAAKVRRWIERDFMPWWKGIGTPLEVFPKQDKVEEGFFGNLVKLPLGRHQVTGNFSEFLPHDGWASGIEDVVPLPVALIPEVVAPAGAERNRGSLSRSEGSAPAGPFPCVNHIQREGVGKGHRDLAMFHLALYWFGHGLDQDQAEEVCVRANENFDPPLSEREVREKVASAYRGRYASARCGTDWLVDVCPGPCRSGWSVREVESGQLRRAKENDLVEVKVVKRQNEEGRSRVTVTHPDADNSPTFICGR